MKDDDTVPGLPELDNSPPTEPVAVLPGPQPLPDPAPVDEPRRRRRRKKPTEPEPTPDQAAKEQEIQNCRDALTQTFKIASKVAAKKRGEHWELSDTEAASLGDVWTQALLPYLPKIGAAMPWATALVVTGVLVMPRLERDRELRAQADAAQVPVERPRVVP